MKRTAALSACMLAVAVHVPAFAESVAEADATVTETITSGELQYGLTARTCKDEGRDRAAFAVTARDQEIAQWTLKADGQYVRIHKNGKYDGFGCYRLTVGGIRVRTFWRYLPFIVYGDVVPAARTARAVAAPTQVHSAAPVAPAVPAATAHAGTTTDALSEPNNHEFDIIGSITSGDYQYELTDATCAREAQLQAEGARTKHERELAQWLARQPGNSMTVYHGSAFDGGGCYVRTPTGIRAYTRWRRQPVDVSGAIVPGDPALRTLR